MIRCEGRRRRKACVGFNWGHRLILGPPFMDVGTAATPDRQRQRRSLRRTFLGLQFKFTLLVLSLALGVAVVVGGLLFDLTGELTGRQKREQCLQLSALLAKSSALAVQLGDREAVQALAEESSAGDDVLFVAFTDPGGSPIAVADPSGICTEVLQNTGLLRPDDGTLGRPVLVGDPQGADAHLQVTYPVNSPQTDEAGERPLLGYVRVGLDVERAMRLLTAAFDLFSGISIAVLPLAVPLAYILVRCVVVPLNELSRVVQSFAEGDLEARSSVRRSDEIGELAEAFNGMADELTRKHQEIVALNADLEERVRSRTRQLRELASREPLTGLYNRRHFDEVLANRFSESARYGTDMSCMMLDLDDFKSVNDRFGHSVGDELLILTSITIASQLRAADVAARFGGDEFIVLLPQTDAQRAQVLGARIADKFMQDMAEQLPYVQITLSIGIASMADADADTSEDLIRAADRALYRAKATGKSRIVMSGAPR
ncbi:MAG: GGDEF domain-containing protein [Planctomycetota bacterium]